MQIDSLLPLMNRKKIEQFWKKVNKNNPSGCWTWIAHSTYGQKGRKYGLFIIATPAHRLSYEMVKGPIPDGEVLDHLCRNTLCVNPDHLEAVSWAENIYRGRNHVAVAMRREICKEGHKLILKHHPSRAFRGCDACLRQRIAVRRAEPMIREGMAALARGGEPKNLNPNPILCVLCGESPKVKGRSMCQRCFSERWRERPHCPDCGAFIPRGEGTHNCQRPRNRVR